MGNVTVTIPSFQHIPEPVQDIPAYTNGRIIFVD